MFDAVGFRQGQQDQSDQDAAMSRAMALIEATVSGDGGRRRKRGELVILGKAGTGKTHLLVQMADALSSMGFENVAANSSGTDDNTKTHTYSIISPTNKAVSVLRKRGVTATTIHRLLYVPVYAPDYEALVEWLRNPEGDPPGLVDHDDETVDQIIAVHQETQSMPAALGAVGLRASDFITGWRVRDTAIDVGLVDEASMVTAEMMADARKLFKVLIFFGDAAQLAPVGCETMPVAEVPAAAQIHLTEVRRQSADNPILDIAYLIQHPDSTLRQVEAAIREAAARDDRIVVSPRACSDLMATSPLLVWRNDSRRRVIEAWRKAQGLDPLALGEGEPVVVNGVEMKTDDPRARLALEEAGLVKGASAIYLGPGRRTNYVRLGLPDMPGKIAHVGAIVEFEQGRSAKRSITLAARFGVILSPGCAITCHKAQGSQWPTVQVFGPDIAAAAKSGRVEAGQPLWKRLAYVAVTRAQERLVWVTSANITRPREPLVAASALAA